MERHPDETREQASEGGENPLLQRAHRGVRLARGQAPRKGEELTALQRLSMTKADIMSFDALLGQLQGAVTALTHIHTLSVSLSRTHTQALACAPSLKHALTSNGLCAHAEDWHWRPFELCFQTSEIRYI
jgi:hypothetical protein